MATKLNWGSYLLQYFNKSKGNESSKNNSQFNTNYNKFEKAYFGKRQIIAEEPIIPDEEYAKELEMANLYEMTSMETPKENESVENDLSNFSNDELEEFKRLNGINEEKIEKDKVKEHPTETTVKSIKVSKPRTKKGTEDKKEKESKSKIKKSTKRESK